MAVSYGSASTAVLAAAQNPGTITPTMPAGVVAGNLLILFVGLRSDTASVATPAGWTLAGGVGGGGGTFGASLGPSRMTVFYRVATGTGDTLGALTLTGANMAFCQVVRLVNATGEWSVAAASGSDSTVGTAWSVACDVNPGLTAGDFCVVGSTNAQAGSTWSAQAIAATGVTAWGTAVEISEFNSTTGSDINGMTFYRPVTTGTSTAAPTVTATLAGTTTNARGVSLLVRAREAVAPPAGRVNPEEISGLIHRFRASDLALSDGAAVASWPSLVGTANLTQATAGNRPTYVASGMNGQPVVRFTTANQQWLESAISAQAQPLTVIYIHKLNRTVAPNQQLFHAGSEIITLPSVGNGYDVFAGSDLTGGSLSLNPTVFTWVGQGGTSKIIQNGTQQAAAGAGGNGISTPMRIGAKTNNIQHLDADVPEILIYNKELTASELASVHSYAQDRYGIPVSDYVAGSNPAINVTLPLLTSTPAQFAPTVTLGAAPPTNAALPFLTSAAVLFGPTVQPGAISTTLPLLTSTPAQFAPTVSVGAVTATLPLLTSTAAQFAPTVTPGAISTSLPLLTSTAVQFDPTVTPGALAVSLPLLTSTAAQFAPTVSVGAVSTTLPLLTSAPAQFAPTVTGGPISVEAALLSSPATLYAPTVNVGGTIVSLPLLTSTPAQFAPTVTGGPISVTAARLTSTPAQFAPTVTGGPISVTVVRLDSTADLFEPEVTVGAITVTAPFQESLAELYSPVVDLGPIDIGAPLLVSESGLFEPSVFPGGIDVETEFLISEPVLFTPIVGERPHFDQVTAPTYAAFLHDGRNQVQFVYTGLHPATFSSDGTAAGTFEDDGAAAGAFLSDGVGVGQFA